MDNVGEKVGLRDITTGRKILANKNTIMYVNICLEILFIILIILKKF